MRLMSACAIAMSAAINAVVTPIHTTTVSDAVTPLIAPNEKTGYTRATSNERLFCRRCGARSLNPKPNEQIGRQADQLPADKQKKQAVRNNEPEHCTGEKRKISEKADEILIAGHITSAEDEDAKPDKRDHH